MNGKEKIAEKELELAMVNYLCALSGESFTNVVGLGLNWINYSGVCDKSCDIECPLIMKNRNCFANYEQKNNTRQARECLVGVEKRLTEWINNENNG